jgi:hypothetical protein
MDAWCGVMLVLVASVSLNLEYTTHILGVQLLSLAPVNRYKNQIVQELYHDHLMVRFCNNFISSFEAV